MFEIQNFGGFWIKVFEIRKQFDFQVCEIMIKAEKIHDITVVDIVDVKYNLLTTFVEAKLL